MEIRSSRLNGSSPLLRRAVLGVRRRLPRISRESGSAAHGIWRAVLLPSWSPLSAVDIQHLPTWVDVLLHEFRRPSSRREMGWANSRPLLYGRYGARWSSGRGPPRAGAAARSLHVELRVEDCSCRAGSPDRSRAEWVRIRRLIPKS